MDEILVNNFMVFDELIDARTSTWSSATRPGTSTTSCTRTPELKRFAVRLVHRLRRLASDAGRRRREAALTADYNAEMIEQRARFRALRDRSIFVGDPDDVVPDRFGPGLPGIRDWTEREFDFAGYVTGFDPSAYDVAELRARLGHRPDERSAWSSVGGSGVGAAAAAPGPRRRPGGAARGPGPALRGGRRPPHRPAALPERRARRPATSPICTGTWRPATWPSSRAGSRPAWSSPPPAVRVRAAASTTSSRPSTSATAGPLPGRLLPGLRVASTPTPWPRPSSPELGARVDYRPVETDGAARAAAMLADLL